MTGALVELVALLAGLFGVALFAAGVLRLSDWWKRRRLAKVFNDWNQYVAGSRR